MALNDNIKKFREEKKYTQQQLADKLYVSRQTICRWENGSRCPDLITAKKLAMELGVTLDELISDEDITDIQSKYGIWKFDKIKEREKIQVIQKRVLDFIEIVGGIFLAISLLLRVQFDMKVPAWITIICALIVTVAFMFNFMLAKKLERK
ncbi:helix-turn-helix transcriptional regulator [Clostridioides difficile]|nr:helix-turn-helix transcriptional regulator [Clostridioides difficile]